MLISAVKCAYRKRGTFSQNTQSNTKNVGFVLLWFFFFPPLLESKAGCFTLNLQT